MQNQYTLRQVFRKADKADELKIDQLVQDLRIWFTQFPQSEALHPCVIKGQGALVCQHALSSHDPEAYRQLTQICHSHGLYLKENQRTQQNAGVNNRRAKNIAMVVFCFGLMSSSPAFGRTNHPHIQQTQQAVNNLVAPAEQLVSRVKMIGGQKVISLRKAVPPDISAIAHAYAVKAGASIPNKDIQIQIETFLKQAYRVQTGDPYGIKKDLARMAAYYARFPQVAHLFAELKGHNIVLKYKKHQWQAQALGTSRSVDQVIVYFDTRIGAQLWLHEKCSDNPACHITPADALLHELLHAKLMIVDSEDFINKGGMKPTLYLYDHEAEVIAYENSLYQMMSEQDGIPRPLRSRHSGDLKHVNCVLCLPGGHQSF